MSAVRKLAASPVAPTADEVRLAKEFVKRASGSDVRVSVGPEEEPLELPGGAVELFVKLLGLMAEGNTVTVVAVDREMTTTQAAEYLNVSRPYVIKLIDAGELPVRFEGTHRRIPFKDVEAYKMNARKRGLEALEEMSALEQDLGLFGE